MPKTCTRCGYTASDESTLMRTFSRDSSRKDGFRHLCRQCDVEAVQERRARKATPPPMQPAEALHPVTQSAAPPRVRQTTDQQYSSNNGLILVIPDLHSPCQDPAAFGAVLALMRENRFSEVVLLGDATEFVSCSWFGGPETLRSYKSEALEARAVIQKIRDLHSGPMCLTIGNHDSRPNQKVEKVAPQLHGSIVDEVGYASLSIDVIPEDQQPIERGRLRLIHGHQDSGKFPSTYHAKRMVDLYGLPGVTVVYGHTHVSQTHARRMHGGVAQAIGLGCLEHRPKWQKGVSGWTHEVAVADPGTGIVQCLRIVEGVLWYGGRKYSA